MLRINRKQSNSPVINDDRDYPASIENNSAILDNLTLPGETAADIKAGCPGCTWGPPVLNHNESIVKDTDIEPDDLELPDEELNGIQGGSGGGRTGGGDWIMNHNETVLQDPDTQTEMLDDLTVENSMQIKGGDTVVAPTRPTGGGGYVNNHNETTASDSDDEVQPVDLPLPDETLNRVTGGDGVCHGTTVLAWARVDGVSALR